MCDKFIIFYLYRNYWSLVAISNSDTLIIYGKVSTMSLKNSKAYQKKDKEYVLLRAKEKMQQNIVKWWNVSDDGSKSFVGSLQLEDPTYGLPIYTPSESFLESQQQKLTQEDSSLSSDPIENTKTDYQQESLLSKSSSESIESADDALRIANEIFERLNREANEDLDKKNAEIEQAKLKANSEATFNSSTNSPSGLYGSEPLSEQEKFDYDSIMAQNTSISEQVADLVASQA